MSNVMDSQNPPLGSSEASQVEDIWYWKARSQRLETQLVESNDKYDLLLDRYNKLQDTIKRGPPPLGPTARRLTPIYVPPEIVTYIAYYALPPPQLLEPDSAASIWSSWRVATQTTLSLALVGTSWAGVANELLYRDIVLYSIPQVPLLLRSLRDNLSLCSLVRSVRIACLVEGVPQGVVDHVKRILASCPLLEAIALHPRTDIFLSALSSPNLNYSLLTRIELAWPGENSNDPMQLYQIDGTSASHIVLGVERLLQQCTNLSSLKLLGYPVVQRDTDDLLVMPNVETFIFDWGQLGNYLTQVPPIHWIFPKLRRLSLVHCDITALNPFMRLNGATLEYLAIIAVDGWNDVEEDLLDLLLSACPVLEHLYIDRGGLPKLSELHPTLRFIDVLSAMSEWEYDKMAEYRWRALIQFKNNDPPPHWNGRVRWIDINFVYLDCITTLFPPINGLALGEKIRHTIFQSKMIETAFELRMAREEELFPDDASDDDPTYYHGTLNDKIEHSDDSEYWTDSDSKSEGSEPDPDLLLK